MLSSSHTWPAHPFASHTLHPRPWRIKRVCALLAECSAFMYPPLSDNNPVSALWLCVACALLPCAPWPQGIPDQPPAPDAPGIPEDVPIVQLNDDTPPSAGPKVWQQN
jgi:putative component of membrane protein insertase Oxa1/YidC/SpoIIIJ protein YidD